MIDFEMKTKLEEFVDLIKQNPELPVVPIVYNADTIDDGYAWYLGRFGHSCIGEYALYDDKCYDDREDFKERYYECNNEYLCERFNYTPMINEFNVSKGRFTQKQWGQNQDNEVQLEKYLDEVAEEYFTKAIIVYIHMD